MSTGILDCIKARQSCRAFSQKMIEEEKLRLICEAGRLSPSARNSQPWSFILATSEKQVSLVGECTRHGGKNAFTENAAAFIVIVEEENESAFGGKPHRYFAEMDIGMAVMCMILEAQSLGVSSCILGAFNEPALREVCSLDDDKNIKLVIALGYAEDGYEQRDKIRKDFDETVKII